METEFLIRINETINLWNDELKIVKKQLKKLSREIETIKINQDNAEVEFYNLNRHIKKISQFNGIDHNA